MDAPFADLPDALVRDLLAKAVPVAEGVAHSLSQLRHSQASMRNEAHKGSLIRRKADLDVSREPSVVGVDGSYQIHRLTAVDLCAAAAVAVEGTAKEARRHWPEPYHEMWVECLPHAVDTVGVLRGLMVSMEINLARQAPHDLVFLDGSFASLVIYLNQAITNLIEASQVLGTEFLRRWDSGILTEFIGLLHSDRTVAVPKFTSRNELLTLQCIHAPVEVDGKTLATLILEPGEYTIPLPILEESEKYHLSLAIELPGGRRQLCASSDIDSMNSALHDLRVIFFRPYGWVPAIRLELPAEIASSNTRLSMVLEGIMRQFFSPAVIEPYPLFLADRMVKSLGSGVAVIEQTVAQHVAGESVDVEMTLLCLQNYRTEGGRGGV
jgi:hypothetical protein